VPLPTGPTNRYGYDIEFDDHGRYRDFRIDFEALGEHLYQLHGAARARGIGIRRVIFEVPLQQRLWQTRRGSWLRRTLSFSTRPAWVRHDEHYHVDFELGCRPMS
jgi:penicillin-insensitive murein endopeptidase